MPDSVPPPDERLRTFPGAWAFQSFGGISGNIREEDLPGTFVSGKLVAEGIDVLLRALVSRFQGDDRGRNLAQTFVRKADDCHIMNGLVGAEEILHLHRINILASADDDIFLRSTR